MFNSDAAVAHKSAAKILFLHMRSQEDDLLEWISFLIISLTAWIDFIPKQQKPERWCDNV